MSAVWVCFSPCLHFVYLCSGFVSDWQVSERGIIYLFSAGTCSFVAQWPTDSTATRVMCPESESRWDARQLGERRRRQRRYVTVQVSISKKKRSVSSAGNVLFVSFK